MGMTEYIGRNGYRQDMRSVPIGERGWLGNPHPVKDKRRCSYCGEKHTVSEAVNKFREEFEERIANDRAFREAVEDLEGETLRCPCDCKQCHGDVIEEWLEHNQSVFDY